MLENPENESDLCKKYLDEDWVDAYLASLDSLWQEVLNLNSYLFILHKLSDFRFNLFGSPPDRFWNLVFVSMSESCISVFWRICFDHDGDVLTLPGLQGEIDQNITDNEFKSDFHKKLKKIRFNKRLASLRKRITAVRQSHVAHFNRKKNVRPTSDDIEESRILLQDLEQGAAVLSDLFHGLCIVHWRPNIYPEYSSSELHPIGEDVPPDIDKILKSIVDQSSLLHMPEKQPGYWQTYRAMIMGAEDISVLNHWRAKFGLPAV